MSAVAYEQGSLEWLRARAFKFTGTDGGVVEGKNPWKTPEQLTREKVRAMVSADTGEDLNEFEMNDAVMHGQIMEPIAKGWFEATYGYKVIETGLVSHSEIDWLSASPDGLIGMIDGLEIKCPFYSKVYSVYDKPSYLIQCHIVMEVCDLEQIHFVCYKQKEPHHKAETLVEKIDRNPYFLDEELPGSYMPNKTRGAVTRRNLYHAWLNHWLNEYQDPSLRQKHLDPLPPKIEIVEDEDVDEIYKFQVMIAGIEERIADDISELKTYRDECNQLKKVVADRYGRSVGNGEIEVQVIEKKSPVDFKSAFSFLGGEDLLKQKGKTIDEFRGERSRQVSIKTSRSE